MTSNPSDPMPVFVLKGKDALAPRTIAYYGRECGKHHGLHEQAAQVELAYQEVAAWQRRNPGLVKLPDHEHVTASAGPLVTSPVWDGVPADVWREVLAAFRASIARGMQWDRGAVARSLHALDHASPRADEGGGPDGE